MNRVISLLGILLTLLNVFPNDSSAQWVQTNGPFGGSLSVYVGDSSKLFGGGNGGVFLSTDDGLSWKPKNNGLTYPIVNDLILSGNKLLAATFEGVFLSTDYGESWISVNNGLTNIQVNKLAVKDSSIFAAAGTQLFRSTNDCDTWSAIGIGYTISTLTFKGNNLFVGTNKGGVFLSTDNGKNWITVNSGLGSNCSVYALAVSDTNIFAATDKDFFRSANNGTSWIATALGSTNINPTRLASDSTHVYAGTYNNGIFRSIDGGITWSAANSGLPTGIIGYLSIVGKNVFARVSNKNFRSNDYGISWSQVNNIGITNTTPIFISAIKNKLLAIDKQYGVFRSIDFGNNWEILNSGLSSKEINSLAVIDTILFAATSNGVFRSKDYGSSWDSTSLRGNTSGLTVNDTIVYAIGRMDNSGIYCSSGHGINWTLISSPSLYAI